ncbi:MAG TPA: substrate-binding domain-containing protein [Flavobacterium sp.]|jgi:ABC-type nitrate/sulfonate/bicarbonate transport system substrate-binding protein
MNTLKIAGVPEHFNLPWQMCIENRNFQMEEIDLKWTSVPEGTGRLCQMLRTGETDIAVILTEGIVKDLIAGNPSKIVQVYVESPLIWGIHVAADSSYTQLSDLEDKVVAISRPGSGSQLMAYVNAANQGWALPDYEVVDTLDGAVTALTEQKADYFMWERFMTKPLVDRGIFRRIADCPTPWPCFVIAVRNEVLENQPETIATVLDVINKKTAKFKEISNIDLILATRFNQKPEDIREWLSLTQWSQNPLDETMLNKIQNQLVELSVIDKKGTFAGMVHS